jgi:hypothetical protein
MSDNDKAMAAKLAAAGNAVPPHLRGNVEACRQVVAVARTFCVAVNPPDDSADGDECEFVFSTWFEQEMNGER